MKITEKRKIKKRELNLEDEKRLVEQAQKEPQAFGTLFDYYYYDIYNYLLHRTANVVLAQDLTANTFLKALKKIWQFQWRNISISAWLFRIATNEANMYFRKYKNTNIITIDGFVEGMCKDNSDIIEEILKAEALVEREKMFLKLHKSIASLKPRYSEVIVLKYFEKKKIREIAEILNKSEGTVKSLLHRGLKQMKNEIDSKNRGGKDER